MAPLGQILRDFVPGKVHFFNPSSISDALLEISSHCLTAADRVLLAVRWKEIPPHTDRMFQEIGVTVWKTARQVFPLWFGQDFTRLDVSTLELPSGITRRWLKAAFQCIEGGNDPEPMSHEWVHQSAQVISFDDAKLIVAIAVDRGSKSFDTQLLLRSVAEWTAKNCKALVLVLTGLEASAENRVAVDVFPNSFLVKGTPDPRSPGEIRLAERLARVPTFSWRFQVNINVLTTLGRTYQVDFLFPSLRLVIEVDGFRYHSGDSAFFLDREKDYELTLSGYTVLRLTSSEVIEDTDRAVEKIRNIANHLTKQRT